MRKTKLLIPILALGALATFSSCANQGETSTTTTSTQSRRNSMLEGPGTVDTTAGEGTTATSVQNQTTTNSTSSTHSGH